MKLPIIMDRLKNTCANNAMLIVLIISVMTNTALVFFYFAQKAVYAAQNPSAVCQETPVSEESAQPLSQPGSD